MTTEQIKQALDLHSKWLRNEEGGQRADLSEANLNGADLSGADLSEAYLEGTATSTPVDLTQLSADEFLDLVRAGRVTTASPYDGDDVSVMISHKWADQTEIQWVYEIPAAVECSQEPDDTIPDTAYGFLVIKEDEFILRTTRSTVGTRGRIFTITQP